MLLLLLLLLLVLLVLLLSPPPPPFLVTPPTTPPDQKRMDQLQRPPPLPESCASIAAFANPLQALSNGGYRRRLSAAQAGASAASYVASPARVSMAPDSASRRFFVLMMGNKRGSPVP